MVGNDTDLIYSMENQENIKHILSNVFTHILVKLLDGSKKNFSSFRQEGRMDALLQKYGQMSEFMSPVKPLWRHEVLLTFQIKI